MFSPATAWQVAETAQWLRNLVHQTPQDIITIISPEAATDHLMSHVSS